MQERKITVMFLVNYLGVGGAEQQLLELVRGMNKARFQPVVASLYSGGPLESEVREVPGVELISLNRKGKYDFSVLFSVLQLMRQKKVDIIQPFLTPATFFGILPASINRIPVKIITERCGLRKDTSPGNRFYRAAEDFLTRFASLVVPNSEAGRSYLLDRGIAPSRIKVIYNGVNLSRLTPDPAKVAQIKEEMQLPHNGKVIGIVARLHPAKGHDTFLRAAKIISESIPQTRFAVVGDGPLRTDLEYLTRELGVASKVIFFGGQRDVGSFLSTFDVACLCSTDLEGCSNSVLEAMALGKPVVATDVGGNRELVQPDATGLLVPHENPEALVDAVLKCFNRPEWAQTMGRQAQEMVFSRFSQERMVQEYESLYEEALMRKGHRKSPAAQQETVTSDTSSLH